MKCLMPLSAGQSSESLSCEVSQLQLRSEKQLEDDVASDIYTECDINHQEKEIINYLNKNLSIDTNNKINPSNKLEVTDEIEVYSTPNCVSPEDRSYEKTQNSSPSTELKREYYALVPIDGNVLDRELVEQDALSSAFHSINKSEFEDNTKQNVLFVKPTSLSLNSSHMPKVKKHSSICENLQKPHLNGDSMNKIVGFGEKQLKNNGTCQSKKAVQRTESANNNITAAYSKTSNVSEKSTDKVLDPLYTPDSLIADEISSSSDYLSATYAVSPGTVLTFSSGVSQLNVEEQALKMDNIVTISDSGLETAGMLESLNSHKDVTLTDVSLTESTLRDMVNDDNNCPVSSSNVPSYKITYETHTSSPSEGTPVEKNVVKKNSHKLSFEMASPSTKDEKQRLNDIVMQESSSLSSETGSWESVFPPKITDTAEKIISKNLFEEEINTTALSVMNTHNDIYENICPSLVPKSPYKLQCFIDASSLADEGDVDFCTENKNVDGTTETNVSIAKSSQSEPGAIIQDLSPNDSSSIENNDSLERDNDNKDNDLTHKDISPTIFKMSPSTEKYSEWNGIDLHNKKDAESVSITDENNSKSNERIFLPTLHTSSQDNTSDSGFFVVNNSFSSYNSAIENKNKSIDSNRTQFIIDRNCVSLDTSLAVENKPHMIENSSGGNVTAAVLLNKQNYSVYNEIVLTENGYIQIHSKTQIQNNIGNRNQTTQDCPKSVKPIENEIMQSSYEIENSIQLPNSAGPSSPHNSLASLNNLKKIDSNAVDYTLSNSFTKKDLFNMTSKSPSSFWVVDMSNTSNDTSVDGSAKSLVLPVNNDGLNKVENHTSSESNENLTVSTQKFYIDLSKLPDVKEVDVKKLQTEEGSEKNNIFSMFIDLSDKTTTKEMPARLCSSLNSKKNTRTDIKSSKSTKTSVISETKGTATETSANCTIEESILFEKLETLCDDPNISITEIKARPLNLESLQELGVSKIKRKDHDLSKKVIQEEPATGESMDLFVKLSDLDKPAPKTEHESFTYKRDSHERMTRSIPDKDWRESSQTIALKSSSFHSENALSLNRLFPHLKNEFSRSMPGSLSSRTKSPLRHGSYSSPAENFEHQTSDVSEMSSVHSSLRSVVENSSTTEEIEQTSSLISNCQSRLGQDLLRMFLEEIAPDVIVEVKGRRIRAHKCILSSRCQYFAGILSGGWVESAGNVISLPPFAFSVVHFALCHIYSGISVIPDTINILELATLADMLGLEGLKEGIMIMLKTKYCHNFHKPCSLCTAGVMECFPLASLYGLDDLYRKCLRWITKYFQRVWPTKAFATLPAELIDKCCQEHIINLTTENFVDVVYGSGITVSSLSESRWAIVVSSACRRLLNAAAQFAATRLYDVVAAMAAAPAGEAAPPAARALHDCMAAAIEWAPPEQACRAYRLLVSVREQSSQRERSVGRGEVSEGARRCLLSAHAGTWRALCEGALVRSAPRVVPTAAFAALPAELRDRLRQLGCISYGAPAPAALASPRPARRARSSNNYAMRSLDIDQVRACFVPYATKPQPQFGSVDSLAAREPRLGRAPPAPNGKTFPPSVRTTKAQEQRIKYNALKNTQRTVPLIQPVRPVQSARSATSRYLQPHQPKEKPPGKPQARMVSSSDSSRMASPTQRGARARGTREAAPPPRLRTADPSLDSLAEPDATKYATYTKARHNNQGSVEAVHTLTKNNNKSVKVRIETQAESPKNVKRQQQKTKIPVFTKTVAKHNKASQVASNNRLHSASTNSAAPQANTRKPSGSLMNSTKSSQAKIVNKTKETGKQNKSSLEPSTSKAKGTSPRSSAPEIPVMERSGTFLKDEPSFKDKTTDIDIDN